MDNLAQWLTYLESIHPTTIDMGLDRTLRVAQSLHFNWNKTQIITVGGTNGKGTTCRFLEHYLMQLGKSVATFRSPHLIDYRERVTFNGAMLEEKYYVDAFKQVEAARDGITLTYFEFGTLAALVMMKTQQPDVILLEVGLGGRLDATNIVDSDCAVITSIGLDHQDYLGDTREAIAAEKAGIFREGKPVVIGESDAPDNLVKAADENGPHSSIASRDFIYQTVEQKSWTWNCADKQLGPFPMPCIPVQNASTALAVLNTLGYALDNELISVTCRQAKLPGRRHLVQSSPFVMLDVAHNPQAAISLLELVRERSQIGQVYCVVAMLKDKDIAATLACFENIDVDWLLADTKGARGCNADVLKNALPSSANSQNSVYTYSSVKGAYQDAILKAQKNDGVFVFGSFLTVADVLAYLEINP
ncbi:bifunctional tetrahydrofolate synthase/dihydrofolate synthase [Alteromonas sp. 5E99-2]|uniref:bifunctional tetrahydrofolate synthase/dihydrofolate synthase n=1 Tax=Alteromonas sp. 5E99-2 TaxID=2817683 RepID=UPI001A99A08C|nr:bifunctional tetrahydrofolate synthase/dihydrofolate synthase [Alteromonas sp. 5E99-2]MBO1256341.1 bifunctional tetrahydrofolate synthase/dihydrofolate synthase [Alteromonas sp. 5E99-2]